MNEWKSCNLSEVIKLIGGGTPKTTVSEYWNGNIPWLSVVDFNDDNRKVYKTEKHITELGLNNSSTKLLEENDIIVSARGTVGVIAQLGRPMAFNQSCYGVKNTNDITADFLYYLMKTKINELKKKSHGSVFSTITRDTFDNIVIKLPHIETQKQIAKILSSIDDKIELNNKINDNLEKQAQAIFKSWFVDFSKSNVSIKIDSVFGSIPSNFNVQKIGELPLFITDYVSNGSFASLKENVTLFNEKNFAYFIRNTDLKSGNFEVYLDEHSYNFLSKSKLFGGEIIISNVGDVGSVFLCPKLDKPMSLGNNIIMLKATNECYQYYLYIWFKWLYGQSLMQGIKGGSAQPKFNKTDFKNLPILIPPIDLLNDFHTISSSIFEIINNNNSENSRLAQLRDTLLPRLMSGEIDVSSVEIS